MEQNSLNFNPSDFVLYQILPDDKKISFLSDLFNDQAMEKVTEKFFENHFGDMIAEGIYDIGIMTYLTSDNKKVNVLFNQDTIHVNSNSLRAIKDLVLSYALSGHIIVRDHAMKKTKKNKERFYMRFYRGYRRLNRNEIIPIVLS